MGLSTAVAGNHDLLRTKALETVEVSTRGGRSERSQERVPIFGAGRKAGALLTDILTPPCGELSASRRLPSEGSGDVGLVEVEDIMQEGVLENVVDLTMASQHTIRDPAQVGL